MWRLPVRSGRLQSAPWIRWNSSSSYIRSKFIEYFVESHGHKHVKSSPVVPLFDPTVPFVNAGMNQFKPVFMGQVDAPSPRVVNSQKCIRIGGKHNDYEVVGTDGTHHTFFEMLGNWSFGDYYKKEACKMAWDLLLGPYRLKPENLMITYFEGDPILNIVEDRECRDVWKEIGVPSSRLLAVGAKENFWEMGQTGPCGPCTEIHYINSDGSLTEIWNIVFIGYNRESNGKLKRLKKRHVDTGMGLERMAAIMQDVPSNYDTDLFKPIIEAIEENSDGVPKYSGSFRKEAVVDFAYRRLADHARMISVALADGVFPAANLNLKQVLRKSFKISCDVFNNPELPSILYTKVASILGSTYPELNNKECDVRLTIEHESMTYIRLRNEIRRKWKNLVIKYPEVEAFNDVEIPGFSQGYMDFKQAMTKLNTTVMPGGLVFKLYDTHGFEESLIQRIADINNMTIDKKGFWKLLKEHKNRHKAAFKEQTDNRGAKFADAIDNIKKEGIEKTNDLSKYDYQVIDNNITFKPLQTELVAILNEDCEWIDYSDPCDYSPYYIVTKDTNFYCEEGGQIADTGKIKISENVTMNVETVFKIRNYVFHKGYFTMDKTSDYNFIRNKLNVLLTIDSQRRLNIMRNHTGTHLLNSALRKIMSNSVISQMGSNVTDKGFSLNLSIHGEKLTPNVITEAENRIRDCIKADAKVETQIMDMTQFTQEESVITVPGETYPETGLRLVTIHHPLGSKELCCGTHAPSTGLLLDFIIVSVKGQGSNTPIIHALTGENAKQARELFCRAAKLKEVSHLMADSRRKEEVAGMKAALKRACSAGGAPVGRHAHALRLLADVEASRGEELGAELLSIAEAEIYEALTSAASSGRNFAVHFLRCSYLMQAETLSRALRTAATQPALLLGCAGGTVVAACTVPQDHVTDQLTATRWLSCILPVFHADILPAKCGDSPLTYAEMTATKVSLINCEQLVQDAMRVAVQYAKKHAPAIATDPAQTTQTRQHN